MTRFRLFAIGGAAVIVLAVGLLIWGFAQQSTSYDTARDTIERTPVTDPAAISIYTSGTYGFTFFYPASAVIDEPTDALSWRTGSEGGALVVRLTDGVREARVGVSEDPDARSSCEDAGASERALEPLSTGEVTWSVFVSDLLGTDNQRRMTSYRTVRGKSCYAIETFEPLASGGDAQVPPADLSLIVRSFSFAP